ncbi:MAG: hypothetical protein HFE85_02620 [Clostridiales bacterium]|nr:hypothetical protein [Clostridiales bacterium]
MNPNRTTLSTGKIIGMTLICVLVMTVFAFVTQSCGVNKSPASSITETIATEDLQKLMDLRYEMSPAEVEAHLGKEHTQVQDSPVVWRYQLQNDIEAVLTFTEENTLQLAKLEKGDATVGLQLSAADDSSQAS